MSTTGGVAGTVPHIWSFYWWDTIPFIYQGKLRVYFWLLFKSTRGLTQRHSASTMMSSVHWRLLIVAGNFNQCNLWTVLTKYHQLVDIPSRGKNILDNDYSNICGGLIRSTDNDSNSQTLSWVWLWTSAGTLQDCIAITALDVFRAEVNLEDSSVSINDYA